MVNGLGEHIRERREKLKTTDKAFSLRQVAQRVEVEPSYLSKVERGLEVPSEPTVRRIAEELGANADVMLALAGKVSSDLQQAIRKRPELFAQVIRELAQLPDHAVIRLVREVRDGTW